MKFCSKCGKQVEDDVLYCPECGSPINGGTNPQFNQMNNYQPTQTNGFAVAALILSLLCGPLLGLIFGIVGLAKSKELNGSGRGLAIAAIVISIVSFIFAIIMYAMLGIFLSSTPNVMY